MRIRLGEEDRKALGCDEWLQWDGSYLIDDAIDLEDQAAITPELFLSLVRGTPVFDAGQPVLDESGEQVFRRSPKLVKVMVWMALRRANTPALWSELSFDFRQMDTRSEPGEGDDEEDKTPAAG